MQQPDPTADAEHATCRHGIPLAEPPRDSDECDEDCEVERCIWGDACAHRDRQVIAYLQEIVNMPADERPGVYEIMEAIERGEHSR